MSDLDWGNVPTAIGSASAVLALAWAVATYNVTAYRNRRAVARSVFATHDSAGVITVRNLSDAPVTGLAVYVGKPLRPCAVEDTTLAPDQSTRAKLAGSDEELADVDWTHIQMQFREPRGFVWQVDENGKVERCGSALRWRR